jgi:hypothetical protein
MAGAHRDWAGHDAGRYLPDDRCGRACGRARRHFGVRSFGSGQRLRRAVLCRICVDGSGRRKRLHVRICNVGRVGGLDHRLGLDSRIRPVARADRVVALGLFSTHAGQRRHRVSRVGADGEPHRRPPANRRVCRDHDHRHHRLGRRRHPRVGRSQRRPRPGADPSSRRTCIRSRRLDTTVFWQAPRSCFLPTSVSIP